MLKKIVRTLGGDPQKKQLQAYQQLVDEINALEARYEAFSDEELAAQTRHFRARLAAGETLDDILVEAYAVVREVSKRTLGLRHYDVQMIGGIAMHRGTVAEMRTGEGKTLTATLPLYLNALTLNPEWVEKARRTWGDAPEKWMFSPIEGVPVGRGVHLVTVNDYLARRDARWMAPIFDFLGLSVGVLQMASRTEHGQKAYLVDLSKSSPHEDQHQLVMVPRRLAYAADITYGTNSEFGFDYLRDNMKMSLEERVQRGHYYAIIDEVDNVLIDEARTPLIISGPSHEDSENYIRMAQVVRQLRPEDYEINERDRTVVLTEIGETHVEQILGQPLRDPDRPEDITPEQARLLGYLEQALRAEHLYKRNKDYVVQGRKVIIVDHFTGRLMPGRRWSDGLHQAVEAKEGVPVQSESVTYATITIQNYFRMYEKLAGMTGTAVTEAEEFSTIYNLETLAIPTNLDYEASRPDSPFVTLQARDEYGYKYTYYAYKDDPEQKPVFWKRKDYPDVIYRTLEAKLRAVVQEIITYHVIGRPILVGTTSVELSELVSSRLDGVMVRKLAQTLLLRDAWFEKNNAAEDGRQIPALQPLYTPLEKLKTGDMRQLMKSEGLSLPLSPTDEQNLPRLLRLLNLKPEHAERLANVLQSGIPHQVLNARKHTEESQIIAGAGAFGAVTIATNMAGRGVDIKLGGELAEEVITAVNRVLKRNGVDDPYDMSMEERRAALQQLDTAAYGIYSGEVAFFLRYMEQKDRVRELGGLHVIGSERHEARRIDNQLRGRAARQGDPGSSRFYLSLEDELMIRFGGQQLDSLMKRLNVDEAMPISNPLVSRIVEQSQTRVEGANFDVRKHLLEYDDVLNTQRAKIYAQRDRILTKDDLSEDVGEMLEEEVLRRVPEALDDEGGPWKLLSWLEQIQPSMSLGERIFPSYTARLLLENLFGEQALAALQQETEWTVPHQQAQHTLLQLARQAIQAEEQHMLSTVDRLLLDTADRFETQLDERLEALDTFLEGLSLDEQPRSPAQITQELSEVLHISLSLPSEITKALRDDPYSVEDSLRNIIRQATQAIYLKRLVGAVERVLKASLDIPDQVLATADWDEVADQVLAAVQEHYSTQMQTLIGTEESPGQIARDLESNLSRNTGDLTLNEVLGLILALPYGRRQAFDKKSHRRIWEQTTRLTYIYLAAHYLEREEPEEITAEVLDHLQRAMQALKHHWGESTLQSLGEKPLTTLHEKARQGLRAALGEEVFATIEQLPASQIPEDVRPAVADELGRQIQTDAYRQLLLRVISDLWIEYLTQMEALRVSIGLEAYAQRDPLVQYKARAFEMFQNLLRDMRLSTVSRMFRLQSNTSLTAQTARQQKAVVPAPQQSAGETQESGDGKTKRSRRRRRRRK
ncbi:MAG: hypothetical protein D6803_08335 [Anaerolineae bacterium]|nr:MAG: hypothetical protein D6803_08335 [Anaerolineae bacterium]